MFFFFLFVFGFFLSEAIESLQAEVHRLREHLEGTLRTAGPLHRVRAPRSPSKDIRDHTRLHTSTPNPQQRDFRYLTLYLAPLLFRQI